MRNLLRQKTRHTKGYSLAEVLMTVAILVILFALAVPTIFSIQKNLRQKELDSQAESIYMAVQSRLSDLYSSGSSSLYDPEGNSDILQIGDVPSDYDAEVQSIVLDEDSVYALLNDGNETTEKIVTEKVLDSTLKNGHWVVEYIPYAQDESYKTLTAATVYAVYYSTSEDITQSYAENNTISSRFQDLRDKQNRLKEGAKVGYYGGSNVNSAGTTSALSIISAEITSNEEVNKAIVKVKRPMSVKKEQVNVKLELEDSYGHKRTITFDGSTNTWKVDGTIINASTKDCYNAKSQGMTYTFTLTLDDLSSDSTRFVNLYGESSKETNKLVTGSDLTLNVMASTSNDFTVSSATAIAKGNSIFAYEANNKDRSVAYITNGRHLQNLDESSGVNKTEANRSIVTKAVIKNNIDFSTDGTFYTSYGSKYFNGTAEAIQISNRGTVTYVDVPKFKSISNKKLTQLCATDSSNNSSYVLSKLVSETGLFGSVSNSALTIKDITFTGGQTIGSNSGVLVGQVESKATVTVDNVVSYLKAEEDIPTSILESYHLENVSWLNGSNVGGLVGENAGNLTIKNSSSSTVLKGNRSVGGLVGESTGSLVVEQSYSDSYVLTSNIAGGLVGNTTGSTSLSNVYSAGYLASGNSGAGLAYGSVDKIENAYTIMKPSYFSNDSIQSEQTISSYYATVSGTNHMTHVYYLRSGVDTTDIGTGVTSAKEITVDTLGNAFTSSQDSMPYKLMGQSLTTYTYPKLTNLVHYGDWDAEFESGALVYYEKYKDNTYGFEGASVTSTLSNTKDILGDGYGIVFKDGNALPSTFTVTISGKTYTFNTNTSTYYTTENGYRIYPLDKNVTNPDQSNDTSFYTRVNVTVEGETKYYDYNPLFASTMKDVEEETSAISSNPSTVSIRSPRHLYALSNYYDSTYKSVLQDKVTYVQQRNLDYSQYDWASYSLVSSVSSQKPIGGTPSTAFEATYSGGNNTITDVSFITDGNYIGMFGYNVGTVKDVVLATQYEEGKDGYKVQRTKTIDANTEVYIGILVGYNEGAITNSAVAGYYISGTENTIKGYANSEVYIGGFVGYNALDGKINKCSADSPKISVSMFRAECYTGGFVGYNEGNISSAYAITHITSDAQNGNTIIAGFAAYNTGSIRSTYCATALTSSGEGSTAYAYSPRTGLVSDSYYLTSGTYYLGSDVSSYDRNQADSAGTPRTYNQLKASNSTTQARYSYVHGLTEEDSYPFVAYVTDGSGTLVHYGEWQIKPTLGKMGVFYWEHEESGNNNGYKITYLGVDAALQTVELESTLCTSHDDSGVITEYGYGYYVGEDTENVTVSFDDLSVSTDGSTYNNYNEDAKSSLEKQLPGFVFYPYTTSVTTDITDHIYLTGTGTNGTVYLTQYDTKTGTSDTYSFMISPFFGNSMSFTNTQGFTVSSKATAYVNKEVGYSERSYEIRSAQQLQYINWNSSTNSTDTLVQSSNYTTYNYLMNCGSHTSSSNTVTYSNAGNADRSNLVFKQSHDLNAENIENFVPIGGAGTSTTTAYNATLYAWFGGTFDGQSYKIQELNISSKAFSVGLFGTTAGAKIQNTILYSTKGATIQRNTENTDEQGAYSLGGLIGVAYDYKSALNRSVTNCAIAGYNIVDNSKNQQGLGEANVGGLIGVANVNVENCSSVVNIQINATHKNASGSFTKARWGNYIRVGGITGAVQNEVKNCYSGGTMTVGEETLDETYNGSSHVSQTSSSTASKNDSTNIYLSGIAGGAFTMNYCNFTGTTSSYDGNPKVTNCYTYMQFPAMEGTIRNITMFACVADRFEYASSVVTNCYYLESSADIDMSNLPSYYFNSNSVKSCMTDSYKESMLKGSAKWMYKMYNNKSGSDQGTFTNVSSKTYAELSNSSMNTTLGSAFADVSDTDESGQKVDGKYSFNAGVSALDGKNYPFPTVITQTSGTSTMHVHYGVWPNNGPYWENGTDTLDIFSSLDSDGYAYKTFTLHLNGENIDFAKSDIVVEDTTKAEVASVTKEDNGEYTVKIKALKTGSVNVTAKKDSVEASFTLSITADLTANADPDSFVLGEDKTQSVTFTLVPTLDTSVKLKNVAWTLTPSTEIFEDGDVGVGSVSSSGKADVTGYGINATINAKGSVTYNGEKYFATKIVEIDREAVVGLSDSNQYVETSAENGGVGTLVESYDESSKPSNSSTYFLYVINEADFFENSTITYSVTDSEGNLLDAQLDSSTITNNTNGFKTIPLTITVRSTTVSEPITGVSIHVEITKEDKTYTLELKDVSVMPTPYTITLHSCGGTFANKNNVTGDTKTIAVTQTVDLMNSLVTKNGNTLLGWSVNEDSSGDIITSVDPSMMTCDQDYYAIWDPMKANVKVGEDIVEVYYGETTISNLPITWDTNTYYVTGWYDESGKEIIDANGNVLVDEDTWNGKVESVQETEDKIMYTLQPNLQEYKKITLETNGGYLDTTEINITGDIDLTTYVPYKEGYQFTGWTDGVGKQVTIVSSTSDDMTVYANYSPLATVNFLAKYVDGTEVSIADSISNVPVGTSTVSVTDVTEKGNGYILEGWYDVSGTKVLDSNGNVVDTNTFNFTTPTTITLYAKWNRVKLTKTSSLEQNSSYIFTGNNALYAMSSEANGTSSLKAVDLSDRVTSDGNDYYLTTLEGIDLDAITWTYNSSNKLVNGDNQLKGSNGSLTMSSSGTTWSIGSSTIYYSSSSWWSRTYYYVKYSDDAFTCSSGNSNNSLNFYALTKETSDTLDE